VKNIEDLADKIFLAVKSYVNSALRAAHEQTATDFQTKFSSIPTPRDGADGPRGSPGQDGKHGSPGKDGTPGRDGKDGASGLRGEPGPEGKPGKDGSPGVSVRGPQGDRGDNGASGKDGAHGRDGKDGAGGKDGAVGPPGKEGAVGASGKDGAHGRDGKDGAPGPAGKDGAQGPIGVSGARGDKGDRGDSGVIGKSGAPGANGESGVDGRDGRDGKDGPPGRDALQIDVLPAIDMSRSYARGTYASHGGGLIRSLRLTDPVVDSLELAGWQVVIEGVQRIDVEAIDHRNFVVRSLLTSGKRGEVKISLPVMLYRGVWADIEFERGDTVTWDGSLWHCETPTRSKPGIVAKDWKLCTKRGNNGKDGNNGRDGINGKDGANGRDLTQMNFDGKKY